MSIKIEKECWLRNPKNPKILVLGSMAYAFISQVINLEGPEAIRIKGTNLERYEQIENDPDIIAVVIYKMQKNPRNRHLENLKDLPVAIVTANGKELDPVQILQQVKNAVTPPKIWLHGFGRHDILDSIGHEYVMSDNPVFTRGTYLETTIQETKEGNHDILMIHGDEEGNVQKLVDTCNELGVPYALITKHPEQFVIGESCFLTLEVNHMALYSKLVDEVVKIKKDRADYNFKFLKAPKAMPKEKEDALLEKIRPFLRNNGHVVPGDNWKIECRPPIGAKELVIRIK